MSIRAFELVPAIERIQFLAEKARMTIECLECCGKRLYLGTNDSFIVQYSIEEKIQPNGKVAFTCTKQAHKYLGLKKPIQEMKSASALNRILVNCDSTLFFLNMMDLEPVPGFAKMKGITAFCVNENPGNNNPFCIQVCIAKRKQIMIYNIIEDKAIHLKDISLSEPPVTIAMDGTFVCAALTTQYVIINCERNSVQDLFPYESDSTNPIVKRISKEEFLLNGPNALGMFVTAAGISERPPIQWLEQLHSAAYSHPYILAIDSQFIVVYSILDQQLKQNLPFQGGLIIGNFDGKIYAASHNSVYAVIPIPWEKQIQSLLADERVSEALELANHANKPGMSKEQFNKIYQRIEQQACFIYFSKFQFEEAKELFLSSGLDVRELICLYPNLLPASCFFTRSAPPLHSIADINQMCQGKPESTLKCKKFLISYLEEVRPTRIGVQYQYEIDTALLKLYAEVDSPELTSLIVSLDTSNDMIECVQWLEQYERYSALGLFYRFFNNNEGALKVWVRILKGEITDESFGGLGFLIEFLANLDDEDLVWQYVDFVLDRDQDEGVKIFTERPIEKCDCEKMKADIIVEYLHRYPKALLKYLEFVVFDRKLEKEKFHTHLAILYLDSVLELLKNRENIDEKDLQEARTRLQHLLKLSSIYRVQLLLGKIKDCDELKLECAILYGKLEEHEKALKILVHELNDHKAAEEYCIANSATREKKYKRGLFHILLSVYMDPKLNPDRQQELLTPAVRLLNSEAAEFDTAKVLQLIPHQWGIGVIDKFLRRALRSSMHNRRMRAVDCRLSKCENLQVKFAKYDLIRDAIIVTEEKTCVICKRTFIEANFTRFPTGEVAHLNCARSASYCNLTGKLTGKDEFR